MIFSALDSEATERQCLPSVVGGYHKRKESILEHYYKQDPRLDSILAQGLDGRVLRKAFCKKRELIDEG